MQFAWIPAEQLAPQKYQPFSVGSVLGWSMRPPSGASQEHRLFPTRNVQRKTQLHHRQGTASCIIANSRRAGWASSRAGQPAREVPKRIIRWGISRGSPCRNRDSTLASDFVFCCCSILSISFSSSKALACNMYLADTFMAFQRLF